MASLTPFLFPQFSDDNGAPLSGGKIYAYAAGTVTPKDTYTSAAGDTANANPIILNSAGRKVIFLGEGSYDFALYNSSDALIDTISSVAGSTGAGVASLQTVSTIAALRALASGSSTYVDVGGYFVTGDGGGGWFYWDATSITADNDGTVITPSTAPGTGRWVRIYSGPINIKWFGAVGDGATSSQTAVTASLIAANAGGKAVFIPKGTFLVTGISLAGMEDMVLEGDGLESIILGAAAGGTSIIRLGNGGSDPDGPVSATRRLVARNFSLAANGTFTYGLYLHSGIDCRFQNISIISSDITTGMYINYSWNNEYISLQIECPSCVEMGFDNVNEHSFIGGRYRSTDNAAGSCFQWSGQTNAVIGADMSGGVAAVKLGRSRGSLFQSCYSEADVVFAFGARSGQVDALNVTGCYFASFTTAITFTGSAGHRAMSFRGNFFKDGVTVWTPVLNFGGFVWEQNYYENVTNTPSSVATRATYGTYSEELFRQTFNHRVIWTQRNVTSLGTVQILDDITRLTAGAPAMVKIHAISRDSGVDSKAFQLVLVMREDDNIDHWELTDYKTSIQSISGVQVTAGALEVLGLSATNWCFHFEAFIWE